MVVEELGCELERLGRSVTKRETNRSYRWNSELMCLKCVDISIFTLFTLYRKAMLDSLHGHSGSKRIHCVPSCHHVGKLKDKHLFLIKKLVPGKYSTTAKILGECSIAAPPPIFLEIPPLWRVLTASKKSELNKLLRRCSKSINDPGDSFR